MEFTNRDAVQSAGPRSAGAPALSGKQKGPKGGPTWLRVVWVVLLASIAVVVLALSVVLYFGGAKETKHVDGNKHQAVFLSNGQVYFGKIKSISDKHIDLRGIFYLNVNQQVQPEQQKEGEQQNQNNITLVKLGCELHGPTDQMLINRDQVTFWENLKDDSQVTKAVSEWAKQNPNGQTCPTPNS